MSFDRLQEKILELGSPCVVGLDPKPDYVPQDIMSRCIAEYGETLKAAAAAYTEFSHGIIDAVAGIVPAIKPQAAYFEALGPDGFAALHDACAYAKSRGLYVIMDAKRGDIGTTAQAYSQAFLGRIKIGSTEISPFDCDAVTVNTYLGTDGIKPFLETAVSEDKAIFALVKTSNPSSGELQDLTVGGEHIYEHVGSIIS
ncbi:MAG: orotidine-5'-phosphate decarboxylase, partial [Oscillospiraceae bacterium]|nr:orotidine-5'-phosphate decarboxylase [Oscillospiraceae bacterium]